MKSSMENEITHGGNLKNVSRAKADKIARIAPSLCCQVHIGEMNSLNSSKGLNITACVVYSDVVFFLRHFDAASTISKLREYLSMGFGKRPVNEKSEFFHQITLRDEAPQSNLPAY